MINKKFIQLLKQEYDVHEAERRQIISLSNVVLHDSKRVIFSLHRADAKKARESLAGVEKILVNLEKKFSYSRLAQEGAYRASVEEYVEAKMLCKTVGGEKVDAVKGITINAESYLGGICDLTGELVRQAINQAARGQFKEVARIKEMIDNIMSELVEFDMAGYLRTKYDQAKGNLRKIEQINYEINLRK